jgi:hypothetical protein
LERHLFAPGLLGPLPQQGVEPGWSLPGLETVLARADRLDEAAGFERALFELFGVACPDDADLPTASLCYLADFGSPPNAYVLHADPVELIPDRDSLIAFGFDRDPLDEVERAALVDTFNEHFGDDGLSLTAADSGRFYLQCDKAPSLRTHPLHAVLGRIIDPYLPDGADALRWRGLANEVQMLCFAHDVNRQREVQGRSMLAGFWFSGGGSLPGAGTSRFGRVRGEHPLTQGLAQHSESTGDDELWVEFAPWRALLRADLEAWWDAVGEVDTRLARDMVDGVDLYLHAGNGRVFRWRSSFARRWWRRRRSLPNYLDTNGEGAGQRV